jgi:hypothetical protein
MKRKRNTSSKTGRTERGGAKTVLIIFAGVLSAVAIGLTIYGALVPVKKQDNKSVSPSPSASSSAAAKATPTPTKTPSKSAVLDMKELKAQFDLPSGLHDLEYQVVNLSGDNEFVTVGFGSGRMDAQGCAASTSPLGYLSNQTGGQYVATVNSKQYYYVEPTSSCSSDEVTAESGELVEALKNLKSDGR